MSDTDLAIYYLMNYPIGTKVMLESDYPGEEPRKVSGVRCMDGIPYLEFSDGSHAYAGRDGFITKN